MEVLVNLVEAHCLVDGRLRENQITSKPGRMVCEWLVVVRGSVGEYVSSHASVSLRLLWLQM